VFRIQKGYGEVAMEKRVVNLDGVFFMSVITGTGLLYSLVDIWGDPNVGGALVAFLEVSLGYCIFVSYKTM
jgi:hypothetical protein